jgi:transposase
VKARWRKVLERKAARREEDGPDTYAVTKQGPPATEEGYRIVWVRSALQARLDEEGRIARLRKAEAELYVLARRLERRRRAKPQAVREDAAAIVDRYKVDEFLHVDVGSVVEVERRYLRRGRPKPGDPMRTVRHRRLRLRVTRDKAALRAELRVDGVFPLATNHPRASKREALVPRISERRSSFATSSSVMTSGDRGPRGG